MAILERGFAIVSTDDGVRVFSTRQVKPGDQVMIRVSDGDISAKIN
jgi:exonuclease VII large subunit